MIHQPRNSAWRSLCVSAVVLANFTTTTMIAEACTVFVVGKDASTDGSVMVSHSNDGEFDTDPRLVKVPARTFPPNSKRPVYFSPENYPRYVGIERGVVEYFPMNDTSAIFEPIGYIPQVPRTYAYLEETYGAINEKHVGIGESTCSSVFGAIPLGAPNGTALFSIDELTHIAMERASTARQAVQLMGELAVQYGFYGAGEFEGTAESLAVSDPTEAWIFHILPDPTGRSAIWVAQKVPSDSFAVLANMFVIRKVDPNDTENFMMSESVHSVAMEYGWWSNSSSSDGSNDDDNLLDFTKIYSDGEYAHKYYSGRRVWGAYHLAGLDFAEEYVDLQSDPVYPVHAVPAQKLSVQDMFRFHRYTYQGTKYDLGAVGNLAGGPFGTPDRWKAGKGEMIVPGNWERAIGLYRTSDTYVVQSKSTSSSSSDGYGVLWFAPASPLGSVFTPFMVDMPGIPAAYRSGHQLDFSRTSAFWAACVVHNVANLKWSYMIKDIEAVQNDLETKSVTLVSQLVELLSFEQQTGKSLLSKSAVAAALEENAKTIVAALWKLSDALLFKYASGFVNEIPPNGEMSQMVGYPAWWLQAVDYQNGPPPPPTTPKCCHPTKQTNMSQPVLDMEEVAAIPATGKAAMRQFLRSAEKPVQA